MGALSATAAGTLYMVTLGTLYTWGNIQLYILSYMREVEGLESVRQKDAAFGFAALFTGQALFMPLGGIIERRYGPQASALLGGMVMSFGVWVTQYCLWSFPLMIFTYGLINGAGIGLGYTAPLVTSLKWLPEYKGAISGIISAGFGAGALFFNQVQTRYINPENLPADTPHPSSPSELYFSDPGILSRVPNTFPILATCYLLTQIVTVYMMKQPPQAPLGETKRERVASYNTLSPPTHEPPAPVTDVPPQEAAKTAEFWLLWVMFFLNGLGIAFTATFWKILGSGHSDGTLSLIGSVASMFNALGRVFWGGLADTASFRFSLMTMTAVWVFAMATFTFMAKLNVHIYAFWCCLNFFTLGGNFSLFPAATALKFGRLYLGTTYGFIYLSQMAGSIGCAFLAKALLGALGTTGVTYLIASCLSVTLILAASLPLFGVEFVEKGAAAVKKT